MKREEIWAMTASERHACLASGKAIDPDALAGADYRGVSLGLPSLVELITWKTFRKSFRRASDGEVSGLNVRLEQTGFDGEVLPKRDRKGREVSFGPFAIRPLPPDGTPFRCAHGVVFDYAARHPAWNPIARTRDVVVSIDDDHTLLLGALYVELGVALRTPSYFTLEREV